MDPFEFTVQTLGHGAVMLTDCSELINVINHLFNAETHVHKESENIQVFKKPEPSHSKEQQHVDKEILTLPLPGKYSIVTIVLFSTC